MKALSATMNSNEIDWDFATSIMYSTDYYQLLTLKSWLINLEKTPLNRSQPLLGCISDLLTESSKTN